MLGSALLSNNKVATLAYPFKKAKPRGVLPKLSLIFISAPFFNKNLALIVEFLIAE